MDAVVKSVKTHFLAFFGKSGLACASAVLSCDACLEVLLGGSGDDLAKHLCIAGSVICLFESSLAIESANLRITLADRCSGHSQIHANFGTLACEFSTKEILHIIAQIRSDANLVLGSPCQFSCLVDRLKFGFGLLAKRTFPIFGKICKLYAFLLLVIDVAAYCTFVFHIAVPLSLGILTYACDY